MRADIIEVLLRNPTRSGSIVIAHIYPPIAVGIDEPPNVKSGVLPFIVI